MTKRRLRPGWILAALVLAAPAVLSAATPKPDPTGTPVLLAEQTKTTGCNLGPLPDRRCSPGAYGSKLTQAVVCAPGFTTPPYRRVSDTVKQDVEREYGMPIKKYGKTLEIDHIVSLELGGSNNIANLYPEQRDISPGYKVKDGLETKLNHLVCIEHTMTLRTAQKAIAANWEKLYTKVFGVTPH